VKKLSELLKSIAYIQNYLSFLFLDRKSIYVNQIYLYGSVVRGTLTKDSDIDIFINCNSKYEKIIEIIAKSSISKFYKSKDYEKWKYLNYDYPISVKTGNFKEWELKKSILSEGILLYSKELSISLPERKVLFIFNLPKDKRKYLSFVRELFGRKEQGYKDSGFLGKLQGIKLSSNILFIPKENQQKLMNFLQKKNIDYSMKETYIFD